VTGTELVGDGDGVGVGAGVGETRVAPAETFTLAAPHEQTKALASARTHVRAAARLRNPLLIAAAPPCRIDPCTPSA
jgi:hypothetical protein